MRLAVNMRLAFEREHRLGDEHDARDITIRHDLYALSKFFRYAIRHNWTFANPAEEIEIPSDAGAERIHVL